jgi:hypothetical protein
VSAERAKLRIQGDAPTAFVTGLGVRVCLLPLGVKLLYKHRRHHYSESRANALPRAAGVFRRFFDGHRGLQPHEVIEVLEKPELTPVIDCFLHVGRRSYGVDVQKGKTKTEMGKILLEPFFQSARHFVVFAGKPEKTHCSCP